MQRSDGRGGFANSIQNGWHPYLRINRQGKYRPIAETAFRGLSTVVAIGDAGWKGRVVCFATPQRQVTCTLLARWEAGYTDPWLVLTDLAPEESDVAWYAWLLQSPTQAGLDSTTSCLVGYRYFKGSTKQGGMP